MPRDYSKLDVYRRADDLVIAVYDATRGFPRDERFGLTSQMRRAAVSVPANIAEGSARAGEAEWSYFLHIALGSLTEIGYYVHLAHRLGYLSDKTHAALAEQHGVATRMLAALIRSLSG